MGLLDLMRTVRTLGCLVTPGDDSVNISVIGILRGRSRERRMSTTNIPSGMCNCPSPGLGSAQTRLANQDVPTPGVVGYDSLTTRSAGYDSAGGRRSGKRRAHLPTKA